MTIPSPATNTATTTASRPGIVDLDTYDIRFPTSKQLDGSDAMNPDPDYRART